MSKRILFSLLTSSFLFIVGSLSGEPKITTKENCDDSLWNVTLADVRKKLIQKGENPGRPTGRLAEALQLSDSQHFYGAAGFDGPEMKDHMGHEANLITDADGANVSAFVFNTMLIIPKYAVEGYYFEIYGSGELKKAFVIRGKVDENSNAVPKSGEPIILNINDPDVRERFDHEMQVWLKGMHRKKKPIPTEQSQKQQSAH